MRQNHFRGIEWWCEAGHRQVLSTCLYRIDAVTKSILIGGLMRKPWCTEYNAASQPVKIGSTVRVG
jgi:hypothetical protein